MDRLQLRHVIKQLLKELMDELNCNEYLSPAEMAKRIRVNTVTIRRWCLSGELKAYKFGRFLRVKTVDFIQFCEDRKIIIT